MCVYTKNIDKDLRVIAENKHFGGGLSGFVHLISDLKREVRHIYIYAGGYSSSSSSWLLIIYMYMLKLNK